MSKVLELVQLLDREGLLPHGISVTEAIKVAERIEGLYVGVTPESWANAHMDGDRVERKIHFIKDIRLATGCGLLEAKNAAEAAIQDFNLKALKAKLESPDPWAGTTSYDEYYDSQEPPF